MTNEEIKKVADELSFNVGWENIRVVVTLPITTDDDPYDSSPIIDPKFKNQILDWLKGNGQEPSILLCTGAKVEIFGITSTLFNETEPIIRMIGHDKG